MPCCGGRIVQRAKLLLLLAVFMGTSEGSCSKTVIFIRHGQAEHNILLERGQRDQARKILDPPLSALGVQQAEALRENYENEKQELWEPKTRIMGASK